MAAAGRELVQGGQRKVDRPARLEVGVPQSRHTPRVGIGVFTGMAGVPGGGVLLFFQHSACAG